ncbi:hypothetical protein M378DRAFT_167467 [Amanita muscaria Koide BX008]|uniref:Uncharacterized protein n=1 Tax=Amanita muscaria (strain Koide BX008) TaxID=946122 RepID=A0A0C2WVY4_AMAMK|nr:hypothetical protein M378DRAFT_167467 [Amanita muscaria Koide BX008]
MHQTAYLGDWDVYSLEDSWSPGYHSSRFWALFRLDTELKTTGFFHQFVVVRPFEAIDARAPYVSFDFFHCLHQFIQLHDTAAMLNLAINRNRYSLHMDRGPS